MRWLRALLALVALAGMIVGVPWLLSIWSDPSVLLRVPWPEVLFSPAESTVLLGLLGVVGWVAWLVIVATITAEFVSALTHRRMGLHLPGTGWLRPIVAPLVAAVLLAPVAAHAVPDTPAPPDVSTPGTASAPVHPTTAADDTPGAGTQAAADEVEQATPTGRSYTISPGDELWSVAERELGSGERWRDLLVVNPGLSAESRLVPGQRILLPPDVQVRAGDTLWALAERHLGEAERWPEIHALNEELISDPDQIDVGWRLLLPPDDAPTARSGTDEASLARQVSSSPPMPAGIPEAGAQFGASRKAPSSNTKAPPTGATSEAPGSAIGPTVRPGSTAHPSPAPAAQIGREAEASSSPRPVDEASSVPAIGAYEELTTDSFAHIGGLLASSIIVGVAARRRLQLVGRALGRRLIPLAPSSARFWTTLSRRAECDDRSTSRVHLAATTVVLGWRDNGSDVLLDLEHSRCTSIDDAPDQQAVIAALVTSLLCAPWSEEVEVLLVGADQPWATAIDDPRLEQLADPNEAVKEVTKRCAERRVALGARLLDDVRKDPDEAPTWAPWVVLFAVPPTPAQVQALHAALHFGRVGVSVVGPNLRSGLHVRYTEHTGYYQHQRFEPQLLEAPARRAIVDLFAACGTDDTHPAPWWDGSPPRRLAEPTCARGSDGSHPFPHASPAGGSALTRPDIPLTNLDTDEDVPAMGLQAFDLLPGPARRAFHERTPADAADDTPAARDAAPSLVLLGEPTIVDAAGTPPSRARQQTIEYCAWLLFHPGSTAATMARGLSVAEGTRRSNLSRLRTWLGVDAAGQRYLPEAYLGRIRLDERITSDWHRLLATLDGPVRGASDHALRDALAQVGGPPLGTAAVRWPWARSLHDDMTSMIIDLACEYADRSLVAQRVDDALWALQHVEQHVPGHDEIRIRLIKAHSRRPDKAATARATSNFLQGLRDDNRDMTSHHAAILNEALGTMDHSTAGTPRSLLH